MAMLTSLDHWDMRTGRNLTQMVLIEKYSLDHWDMRTGRNSACSTKFSSMSLDHWDMRTGRNIPGDRPTVGFSVSVAPRPFL